MARLEDFDPTSRKHLADMEMPAFASTPWTRAKPAASARVAIISTAGLQRRGDLPFTVGSGDYRLIPGDVAAGDLVMSPSRPTSTAPASRKTTTSSCRLTA